MLKIGIVGLPNVGKSTLFKALTKNSVDIANYPFCTIDPNVGVVEVPDERLQKLSLIFKSKKTLPAAVEFVDIAGLVKGAAEGEGLGNAFLMYIREVDAIAEVVRIFEEKEVIHVSGEVNPLSDIEIIEYELILKDMEIVSKRLEGALRDLRGHKKGAEEEVELLKKFLEKLKEGRSASFIIAEEKIEKESIKQVIKELQLITAKPFIYVLNASEGQIQQNWEIPKKLLEKIGSTSRVIVSAKIESELAELPSGEYEEFLRQLDIKESGLNQLIKIGYKILGLITFFTTGEDESRAWTIPEFSTAPRAGKAIHSDFEDKFIRAEVIQWDKLLEAGSWTNARDMGWLRTEGKSYIVQDGDAIEFKI